MNFGQRFIETKGMPFEHGGSLVQMLDRFPANFSEMLMVTIESTNSQYPQGVGISEDVEIFGQRQKRAVVFEQVSLPPEEREVKRSLLPFTFEVRCCNRKGFLSFYNIAEVSGRQSWWHGGSAMRIEVIPGGRRYRCNDFELDEDFDDLVFTVQRVNEGD